MASEVPDEFNLFGTPLTESDLIINENKLVINENVDYSVMVKGVFCSIVTNILSKENRIAAEERWHWKSRT